MIGNYSLKKCIILVLSLFHLSEEYSFHKHVMSLIIISLGKLTTSEFLGFFKLKLNHGFLTFFRFSSVLLTFF